MKGYRKNGEVFKVKQKCNCHFRQDVKLTDIFAPSFSTHFSKLPLMKLSLAFSPCPNDTFMFDALVNNKLLHDFDFNLIIDDVEKLNQLAAKGETDVSKMSFNAYAFVSDQYQILQTGSALGSGCGPLLVMKNDYQWSDLRDLKIAIPGKYTTANLLLSIFAPEAKNKTEVLFSKIEEAVLNGDADVGLVIHENRFTYSQKGLKKLVDMGELWEQQTGNPIPLGCIAVKRSLPGEVKQALQQLVGKSIQYAFDHPQSSKDFVHHYANEMDEQVQQQHIQLYVNQYSLALGTTGKKAIELLFSKGKELQLLPAISQPLFVV